MIKAILFDLDGTLLPLDEDEFTKVYFGLLCKRFCPLGFDKDTLINAIWQGTKKMIKNNGEITNDIVFWNTFKEIFGEEKAKLKYSFDEFYEQEYLQTASCVKPNPYAREIMDFLHQNNIKIVLASRPVFPKNGMVNRAKFVGLKEEDYWWYLDLRKYGGTHHAGFGLGFERLIMYMTGISNIRDVLPFPRTTGTAEF